MRPSLVLLAGLASSALAYPADMTAVEPRTLGLLREILGDLTVDVSAILGAVLGHSHSHGHSLSLLAGLSAEGAAALQGGALGCKAGLIHYKAKAALKAWLLVHADLDISLKKTLISWCEGNDELVLSADILAALSVYVPGCAEIAAQGQLYVTVDGIFDAAKLESALVLSIGAQSSLAAWIEAKTGLDLDVKVALDVCAAGGVISSLSSHIKAALHAWMISDECDLSADLKVSVLAWISGHAGGDLVEIGAHAETALSTISVGASVGVHVEESGHLSVGGQASLAAFLGAGLSVDLDADVKLALESCAKGQLAAAVDLDLRTKLAIWLAGEDCSLGVELKAVVLLWLSLGVEADVSVSLDLVGGLLGHVTDLLTETLLSGLSVDLRGALSLLAGGGSLTGLTFDARAELAAFLGGCTSIDIDISIQIIILEWFTGCSIPGAPSGPGSSTSTVPSLPGTTVPSGPGATSTPCDTETSEIVGSTVIPGSGSSTATVPVIPTPTGVSPVHTPSPSGPAATSTPCDTETSEIVSSTVIPGVPTGSGSTVIVPVVPTTTPSGPAATSTPCDTETSEIVSSTVIPGVPTGSGSTVTVPVVPTPTGVSPVDTTAPSGPAASSTPCDTETSEIIRSTVIPGGPNGSGSSTATAVVPAVPTGTGVAPVDTPAPTGPAATSTPCDTETSEIVRSTVIPGVPNGSGSSTATAVVPVVPTGTGVVPVPTSAPTGPAATSIPCDTETSDVIRSTVIPGVPTPSGVAPTGVPAPSGPATTSAPTMPAGGSDSEDVTVTKTVTATVCDCE
ncbi:uncharacterized protein N7515_008218 [Penicillium bovifimosum]|uniref:Cell wall protein n=1 Tax=Penicillium bovifimosum TaxID=126998 RepID=A0A9W9GMU3_9EURO|nr:uncharacterized protein N7515_008218 [Penicillium bovifimosum]KAJ5124393.1 hypothetical protein N7515_008218 [Penicillium bovifimosum]